MLTSPDKSPAASLSPLSSRFAAEAERDNIHQLKQECGSLSTALRLLKRSSKEWVMINSKLELASEELACMLEDRNLFRIFAGGNAADLNVEKCPSLIPTPPLGSKEKATNENATAFPPPPSVTETRGIALCTNNSDYVKFVAAIPEPPLVVANPNSSPESEEYGGTLDRRGVQNRNDPGRAWFEINMKTDSASSTQGKITFTIPSNPLSVSPALESSHDPGSAQSPISLGEMTSLPELSKVKTPQQGTADSTRSTRTSSRGFLPKQQTNNYGRLYVKYLSDKLMTVPKYSLEWFTIKKDVMYVKYLSDKLMTVPKYSLEWFTIKKDVIAITRISSDDENESQDEQSQQHQRQPSEKRQCASSTEKVKTASLSSRPKDSMLRTRENAEHKVVYLTEQLNAVPKYSLVWFQMKQEIELLKREKPCSNGLSGNGQDSPKMRTKTKSKTYA